MDSGVVEDSAYVAADFRRKGVGKALLNVLIDASEKEGILDAAISNY